MDEAVALIRSGAGAAQWAELLRSPVLQRRFTRSPAIHASLLALAAQASNPSLRADVCRQLSAHPALAFARYSGSRTLLHDASAAGDLELVLCLLQLGAGGTPDDPEIRSPLYCLANECSAPGADRIVHALLRQNPAAANAAYGVKRCTPLHMAARRGNVEVIEALLQGGAGIEARDSAADTPLRRAVNCNQVAAAAALLAHGADPHSKGSKALTPASAARSREMQQLFAVPMR